MPKEKPTRRPMTEVERRACRWLRPGTVRYTPGSFDKRFGRDMAAAAEEPEPTITEKQAALLRVMVFRYRRQIAEAFTTWDANPQPTLVDDTKPGEDVKMRQAGAAMLPGF